MEPGHEDREYAATALSTAGYTAPQWSPVMKTGNTRTLARSFLLSRRLNGARS